MKPFGKNPYKSTPYKFSLLVGNANNGSFVGAFSFDKPSPDQVTSLWVYKCELR
jgi:hypothetical protein